MSHSAETFERLDLEAEKEGALWLTRLTDWKAHVHRHAELEVNLVESGQATYLVDGQRFPLNRRTLLWLFPGQDHILIEKSPDFEMWIVVWRPDLVESACKTSEFELLKSYLPPETYCRRLTEQEAQRLNRLCEQLAERNHLHDSFNAGLRYLLFEFFIAFGQSVEPMLGGAIQPAVSHAVRLLRDLNPPPSVPVLARQVGLSPSRLSRLFKTQIGLSLTDFRSRQCLERALALCEDPALSLYEIAEQAGFGSYAQFHRVFTSHRACAPSHYRNQLERSLAKAP